jgi:hypothetical protein
VIRSIVITILALVLINIILFCFALGNINIDEIPSNNVFCLEQLINEAEEHTDVAELEKTMPWLDIVSARWKRVVIINSDSFPPGPDDVVTTGIITLSDSYLSDLQKNYTWFEVSRTIPETLVTKEMCGYELQMSQDYENSYLPFIKGHSVAIFIDFVSAK